MVITPEQAKAKIMQVVAAHGRDVAAGILKKLGAAKLPALEASQYPELFERCDELLEEI